MNEALTEAVKTWKKAKLGYIKVELEGDLRRPRGSSESQPCTECTGRGQSQCEGCHGDGIRMMAGGAYQDCGSCNADGRILCSTCMGSGRVSAGQFNSDSYCKNYLLAHISEEAKKSIIYSKFYRDGSVDSEYTFTLKIEHVEYVLEVIKAWNELAQAINPKNPIGGNVKGAGMHIAAMPTGRYPCPTNSLPKSKVENFRKQVTKLLPALYFLASANHQCRSFRYRYPRVSTTDKYSAIYARGYSCFEYRVFETCYKNPEIFLDYVQVIAQTLKYYIDPKLTVKPIGLPFAFVNKNNTIGEMFTTTKQLQALNAHIKHLKPGDKSFTKLKEERGLQGRTIQMLKQKEKKLNSRFKSDYKRYKESIEDHNKAYGYDYKPMTFEQYMTDNLLAGTQTVINV